MIARTLKRFRRAAPSGGLAVACLLVAAGPASAAWDSAHPIDGSGTGYGATNTQTALATSASGSTSSLFFQVAPGTPSGAPGSPFMARRPAGGSASWGAPQTVATAAGQVSGVPQPALSPDGTQGLFWFQPTSGSAQLASTAWPLAAASPSAAGALPCTTAATPECPASGGGTPQVAFDASGDGYAIADGVSGDILLWRTDPATGGWLPPEALAQGGFPRIAVDPAGDVVITYVRTDNTIPVNPVNRLYARREAAGQMAFGPEIQISGSGSVYEQNNPFALVIDRSGTATAVYIEQTTPVTNAVEAVTWPATGQPSGQQISGAPQSQGPLPSDATAVADPQGDVTAAWDSASPNSAVYAAQLLSGGKWGPPTQVSPANNRSAAHPELAADVGGTVTLIYIDNAPPTGSDVDVKATRLPLGGSWSTPVSLRSADTSAGTVQNGSANVAAAKAGQADVTFIQQLGSINRLFATRFADTTPPQIQIVTPQDGATYRQGATVLADYSCADEAGGSGLASCSGPVGAGQAIDTSSAGARSFTVTASDQAGNTASHTVQYTVQAGPAPTDRTPPQVTISAPRDGAVYRQGQPVIAGFSCSDLDSSVSLCKGTVANGSAVDTRTVGRHSFSVTAQDPSGNTASSTVHYTVIASRTLPALRLLVAPRKVKTGKRVHIRFRAMTCPGGRCKGLWAVQVRFDGRSARTNRRGYATFSVVLRKPGRYVGRASEPGYRPAQAIVTARRARR